MRHVRRPSSCKNGTIESRYRPAARIEVTNRQRLSGPDVVEDLDGSASRGDRPWGCAMSNVAGSDPSFVVRRATVVLDFICGRFDVRSMTHRTPLGD